MPMPLAICRRSTVAAADPPHRRRSATWIDAQCQFAPQVHSEKQRPQGYCVEYCGPRTKRRGACTNERVAYDAKTMAPTRNYCKWQHASPQYFSVNLAENLVVGHDDQRHITLPPVLNKHTVELSGRNCAYGICSVLRRIGKGEMDLPPRHYGAMPQRIGRANNEGFKWQL